MLIVPLMAASIETGASNECNYANASLPRVLLAALAHAPRAEFSRIIL